MGEAFLYKQQTPFLKIVDIPTVNNNLTYTGSALTPTFRIKNPRRLK